MMTIRFLPTSFATRETLSPEDYLSEDEVAAIIEREEREAVARAQARRKVRPIGGRRVKYSEDQPRDDHGRFGSGSGDAPAAAPAWGGLVGPDPLGDLPPSPMTTEVADQARLLNAGESINPKSPLAEAIFARTGNGGYTEADHQLIVDAIQAAPDNAPTLYRGFAMNEDNGWTPEQRDAFTAQLTPGAEIQMRLGSYTEDPKVVQDFAAVDSYLRPVPESDDRSMTPTGTFIHYDDQRVILAVQPGAQALNMQPHAVEEFADQAEWATVGTFRVESVDHSDGTVWKVQLAQVDSVEPAKSADAGDIPVGGTVALKNGTSNAKLPTGAGDA